MSLKVATKIAYARGLVTFIDRAADNIRHLGSSPHRFRFPENIGEFAVRLRVLVDYVFPRPVFGELEGL